MPDWKRFQAAMVAGTRATEISNACVLAWSWLDLPSEERRARVADGIRTEAAARWMLQALSLVRLRIWREADIDSGDVARVQVFFDRIGAGRATTDDRNVMRHIEAATTITHAVTELFPGVAIAPVDPDQTTLQATLPALSAAIEGTGIGLVTPDSLETLRKTIETFATIGKGFTEQAARDHAWWMGLAWWSMGRGALDLGRNSSGSEAFEHAAAYYDRAGEAKSAADCRQRVSDLASHIKADFDSAAEPEVRNVLMPQEPLPRVQSLTRLVLEVGRTGDKFEAARIGEEAAQVLREVGFPDPEPAFDAAVDQWIETAADGCTGNALFARVCEVAGYWAVILGARTSTRLKGDPAASVRAERTLRGLTEFTSQLSRQAAEATRQAAQRLAVWDPPAAALLSEDNSIDVSIQRMKALSALDDALQQLRVACNEGASEAQLAQASALRAQAETLGSRVHIARAVIEQVYVLLALQRFEDVPALTDLALHTLREGKPAQLGTFATGFERELYLTAIDYKARALAAKGDHEAILALCGPVIRDIEGERARVSSPYQQSAFLATRAEIYEFVAASAYRTGRLDLLLAVTELLKARAALRSRLTPDPSVNAEVIEAEVHQVNEALLHAALGSDEERMLRERRRWLSTARAIARTRGGAAPPEISVSAIQGVLATDEAAISWFWIGNDIVIVLGITREDVRSAVTKLDATQQSQLADYLACVTSLSGESPRYERLIPRTDELVAALGAVLLPAEVRKLILAKSRLVLSPHRTLHLFPFHAAPWPDGEANRYLIECFAIRYAPNLSSLLLPWCGNEEGPVLAVGVAHFDDPDIPTLRNAEAEAAAVAAVHGANGHMLAGATREAFAALPLRDYRCLHLATHGSSVLAGDAADDPMQSCLYLRDGALSGWDIEALQFRAELVVLAACYSGQRSIAGRGLDKLPGDDLFGLQAVLFEAGIGTVLGALWPVEDATAFAILVDFHRAYAGGAAPDTALSTAIRAHLANSERRQDVFYWAPFFVSALGRRA
jgi:CHAT domain-containing protein